MSLSAICEVVKTDNDLVRVGVVGVLHEFEEADGGIPDEMLAQDTDETSSRSESELRLSVGRCHSASVRVLAIGFARTHVTHDGMRILRSNDKRAPLTEDRNLSPDRVVH